MTIADQPSGASAETVLSIPLAAFGTLSNGSDVRMLARPSGFNISGEAEATIEQFFYAAWKAVAVRQQPYFAFFQLEFTANPLWGLTRVVRLGKGAAGDVLVTWTALLAENALDAIAWRTHRLLYSAFPHPLDLPRPHSILPLHRAPLLIGSTGAVDQFVPAFDWLLYRSDFLEKGVRIAVSIERPAESGIAKLSTQGVLFGIWERMGRAREQKSYSSWAGIESYGFPPKDQPFHIVLTENGVGSIPARANRTVYSLGADPSGGEAASPPLAWQARRYLRTHVQPFDIDQIQIPIHEPTEDEISVMAVELSNVAGSAIVRDHKFDKYRALATPLLTGEFRQHQLGATLAKAIPRFLDSTVKAIARNNRLMAARALDIYLADTVPLLQATKFAGDCASVAARTAVESACLPFLAPGSIETLAPALLAQPKGSIDTITKLLPSAEACDVNWAAWLEFLACWMNSPQAAADEEFDAVVGGAWSVPEHRAAARHGIGAIVKRFGFRRALRLFDFVPAQDAAELFIAIAQMLPSEIPRGSSIAAAYRDRLTLLQAGNAIKKTRGSKKNAR
jgi:hypothetical protein